MTVTVTDPYGVAADPKLPFLAAALCPAEAERQLTALGWPRAGGAGRARLTAIRVTRYKPGRRCLIEYDVALGDGPVPAVTLLGKARAKGADQVTYALMKALCHGGFDGHSPDGVSVPEPVGVVPAFGMWVQRKAPGVPVTRLVGGAGGAALARRVAEAAHKLHRVGPLSPRRHAMADELTTLGDLLATLALERPGWARRLDRLMDGCRRLAAAVPETDHRGIHRDFYPDQVLVDGPRLYLLDFDLYCAGDPALDAGNFLGHLTEQSLRAFARPDALADVERALEDRFVELTGPACRPAVRAYAVLTLVRHVALSTRFPERRPFTERLLEVCEERLRGAAVTAAAVA
jgi:hypothetical protein